MAIDESPVLGRRVVIWGVTGSGKTTLSRRLGMLLGLPVIELDALNWRANWTEAPAPEFRASVEAALDSSAGWVCEGNYRGKLGDLVFEQADSLIWLNLPWRTSFWRLLKRTLGRAWRREELWAGNRESLRTTFLSSKSILWWSISHHRTSVRSARRSIVGVHGLSVYELRSGEEVAGFVEAIERQQSEIQQRNG